MQKEGEEGVGIGRGRRLCREHHWDLETQPLSRMGILTELQGAVLELNEPIWNWRVES
jgi:hypothetical protein